MLMTTITTETIQLRAGELGADCCGIASLERFNDAPAGFHPTAVLKSCKSVIILAARFPVSTLLSPSPVAYTFVRSEEHTSELQSLMRISYAVFCLKKKK